MNTFILWNPVVSFFGSDWSCWWISSCSGSRCCRGSRILRRHHRTRLSFRPGVVSGPGNGKSSPDRISRMSWPSSHAHPAAWFPNRNTGRISARDHPSLGSRRPPASHRAFAIRRVLQRVHRHSASSISGRSSKGSRYRRLAHSASRSRARRWASATMTRAAVEGDPQVLRDLPHQGRYVHRRSWRDRRCPRLQQLRQGAPLGRSRRPGQRPLRYSAPRSWPKPVVSGLDSVLKQSWMGVLVSCFVTKIFVGICYGFRHP